MATAEASLAITEAYRTRVRGIVDQVDGMAADAWHESVSWDDLRETYSPVADRVAGLVQTAQRLTASAAAAYLTAYAGAELGEPQRPYSYDPKLYVGFSFGGIPLRRSLDSPIIAALTAIKTNKPNPMGIGLRDLRNAIDLSVKAAGRRVLQDLMAQDDRIIGWRRAVSGTCGACEGMAQESHLPPGEPLDVHPNCECVSEGVFAGREADLRTSRAEQFQNLSPDEQDKAIGTEAGLAVRKGYVNLNDLVELNPNPMRVSEIEQAGRMKAAGLEPKVPGILRQRALKDLLSPGQRAQLAKDVNRRHAAQKAGAKRKANQEANQARVLEEQRRAEEAARAEAEAQAREQAAQLEFDRRQQEIADFKRLHKEQSAAGRSRIGRLPQSEQKAAKQKEAGRKAALNRKVNERQKQLDQDRAAHEAQKVTAPTPDKSGGPDPLMESRVSNVKKLGGGITSSQQGVLDNGTRVVLKRVEKAAVRDSLDETAAFNHSRAAYRIAQYLDVQSPRFVVRDLGSVGDSAKEAFARAEASGASYMQPAQALTPSMDVGMQTMVPGFDTASDVFETVATREDAMNMQVLDQIVGSTDRHGGNYGYGPARADGSRPIVAIDNDLSFPTATYDLVRGNKTVWASERSGNPLTGRRIPAPIMDKLKAMVADKHGWEVTLRNEDGLTGDEVSYMWDRIDAMVRTGRFPNVRGARPAYFKDFRR